MRGRSFSASFLIAMLLMSSPVYAGASSATSTDPQLIIQLLQDQIKTLEAQIEQLKAQLESTNQQVAAIQAELKISRFLTRGVTGEDVKQLQAFLSQFPDIYPEGLITGYFGPLTETAVRKLQEQNGIEPIGAVGPKTLAKINALITEGAGGSDVPVPTIPVATPSSAPIIPTQQTTPTTPTTTASVPLRDTTPPIRSNGSPFDILTSTTTSAKVSLTTDEPSYCYWSSSPDTPFDYMATPFTTTGSTIHSMVVQLVPSTYSFYVRCRDQALNTNTSDYPILFSVAGSMYNDVSSPPRVSMSFPTNGDSVTEGGVTLSASASDNAGVIGVQFYLNSQKLNAEDTSTPFTATTTLTPNTYTTFAVARDLAGNRATSTTITFSVKAKTVTTVATSSAATSTAAVTSTTPSTTSSSGNSSAGTTQTNTQTNTTSGTIATTTTTSTATSTSTTISTSTAAVTPTPVASTNTSQSTSGTPTGVCQVRNNSTSVVTFSAPDLGNGYAKVAKPGINTISGLRSACTRADYDTLLRSYCTQNSSPVQQEVVTYSSSGSWLSTGGGPFGDNPVSCPAAISQITQVQGLTATVSGSSVTLSWQAVPEWNGGPTTGGYNIYRGASADFIASMSFGTDNHIAQGNVLSYTDANLSAGAYYYKVAYQNNSGTVGPASQAASATIVGDTTPPIISSVSVSPTETTATITWTTNEPTDTRVSFGLTSSYNGSNHYDYYAPRVTSHSALLEYLTRGTAYHYNIQAYDASGNIATSDDYTFTTLTPTVSSDPGNSILTVERLFIGQYDNTKYKVSLSDPDGIGDIAISKAGGSLLWSGSPRGGSPPCPVGPINTGTVTLLSSDFPLQGWVIDCVNTGVKYSVQASMPALPTSLIYRKAMFASIAVSISTISTLLEKLLELLKSTI